MYSYLMCKSTVGKVKAFSYNEVGLSAIFGIFICIWRYGPYFISQTHVHFIIQGVNLHLYQCASDKVISQIYSFERLLFFSRYFFA